MAVCVGLSLTTNAPLIAAAAFVAERPRMSASSSLQHARGLVSIELADHYRELGSADEQVSFSDWRRFRQDFQNRRAAVQLQPTSRRLREVANWRTEMSRSRPAAIAVPEIMAR